MSKYLKKKSSLCNISSCIQNDEILTTIYISSLMIAFEICEVQFSITNSAYEQKWMSLGISNRLIIVRLNETDKTILKCTIKKKKS